jgi:hypothetical protein
LSTNTRRITEEQPLADQLQEILKQCPHVKGYKLSVMELPHAIVIGGTVTSYYHKQVAQEAVVKHLKPKMEQGLRLMLKNEIVVKGGEL